MNKRLLSLIIALIMIFLAMPAAAFAGSVNGSSARSYEAGFFSDVDEDAWYGANSGGIVAAVWEAGLMDGVGQDRFGVGRSLTIAQALVVADKIHCSYETGTELAAAAADGPWYQFFVDYALEHKIIEAGEFADYNAEATRRQMVHIFAHCLPESQFAPIGIVEALPDVEAGDKYADEIFMFYQAGILSGSDSKGTFHPDSAIKREEAAAIFIHICDASTRKVTKYRFLSAGNIDWSRFDPEDRVKCNAILAAVLKPNMSDREKVVAIHDYMVAAYHYDYDVADGRKSGYGEETYDYTCLLKYGVGVCEAYMELFSLLCNNCGVVCEMVIGGGHGWNRVWIDGGWLYVDVTYDDPIVYHNGMIVNRYSDAYLLKTEKEMSADHTIEITGAWLTGLMD